jgi:NAD(P)-dependent dehydrogenase (short-subunit alcohol dehydrogenase family)
MGDRLKDKVAIVMGASRKDNMGQATARRFIREGARVVVAGRRKDGLEAFAKETGASPFVCDISKKSENQALVDYTVRLHGRVDIGVNTAGIGLIEKFEDTPEDKMDEMYAVLYKGGIFFMQCLIPELKKRGGAIVNVTSAVADIQFEHHGVYMGFKAALNQVTRTVANEFGQYGIRVNIVAPGLTLTPILEGWIQPGMVEAFEKEYPLGRINTVEDVAAACLFAAEDECFMTGETFHVTGGLRLRRNPTTAEIAASIKRAAAGASD